MSGRPHPPGYLVVIDAEGAELRETRRTVTGMPVDQVKSLETGLRKGAGDGCYVVFREGATSD